MKKKTAMLVAIRRTVKTGEVAVGLMSRRGINGETLMAGDNGQMNSTPDAERLSKLAELDPAAAVAPAEDLADQLEAGLEAAAEDDEADPPPS